MTNDQWLSSLRQTLQAIGMMLTTLGLVTPVTWEARTGFIMLIAGPLIQIASLGWSVLARSRSATVASASVLPEVKAMEISDRDMAQSAKDAGPGTKITMTSHGTQLTATPQGA